MIVINRVVLLNVRETFGGMFHGDVERFDDEPNIHPVDHIALFVI